MSTASHRPSLLDTLRGHLFSTGRQHTVTGPHPLDATVLRPEPLITPRRWS